MKRREWAAMKNWMIFWRLAINERVSRADLLARFVSAGIGNNNNENNNNNGTNQRREELSRVELNSERVRCLYNISK